MTPDDWKERGRRGFSTLVKRADERLFLEEERWWGDGSVLATVCLGAWSFVSLAVWGPLFWVTGSFRGWPSLATPGKLFVLTVLLGALAALAGRAGERVVRTRRPDVDASPTARWGRMLLFAVPVWGLWFLHRSLGRDDDSLPDPETVEGVADGRSIWVDFARSWLFWLLVAQVALIVFLSSPLHAWRTVDGGRTAFSWALAVGSSAVGAWATARVARRMSRDLGATDPRRQILRLAPKVWAVPWLGPLAGFVPSVLEQWPGRLEGLVTKIHAPRGRMREKGFWKELTRRWRKEG